MPSLQLLSNGRPSVPGRLCRLGLGWDGTVYVIAAGLCHHGGYGQIADIPRDQGNLYLMGVEMESAGTPPWDWTLALVIPVMGDRCHGVVFSSGFRGCVGPDRQSLLTWSR